MQRYVTRAVDSAALPASFDPVDLSLRGVCLWYHDVGVSAARASCRYRMGHLVPHLRGVTCVVGPRLPRPVRSSVRLLCCIRPLGSPSLLAQLSSLRHRGVRLVGDYDDLLFAGEVSGAPDSLTRQSWWGGAKRSDSYRSALRLFDEFTVASRALARHLRALRPDAPVTLVPNGLSESWVTQGRLLARPWQPGDPHVIRYLSGSPSHDQDFEQIIEPLSSFLRDHPQTRLEVLGPLRVDPERFPVGRFTHLPRLMSYEVLPSVLSSSWVTLAPLAKSAFSESRSAIKFLEAGAFGCPALVSLNDDLQRHREQGAPIQECQHPADWYTGLKRLLAPQHRMEVANASLAYILQYGLAARSAANWRRRFLEEDTQWAHTPGG